MGGEDGRGIGGRVGRTVDMGKGMKRDKEGEREKGMEDRCLFLAEVK